MKRLQRIGTALIIAALVLLSVQCSTWLRTADATVVGARP